MKVICNRGALLEALTVVGNVVAARTPKPILQCLKLSAADGVLTVAGTDLEVAILYSDSQVQIERDGQTLLRADKLRDIVRESMDDTLSIEIDKETASIKGEDSHFKIFTQDAAEFPAVPGFEGEPQFQIAGGEFKRLIGQTLFATAKEGNRFAYNAIQLAAKAKKLSLVSTDSRRLALAKGNLLAGDKLEKDGARSLVPAKAMAMVEKLLNDPEEPVGFQLRENQIIFHTSSATLTSNLVEGQFPPYEDVIPKDPDKKMTAATADFLSAIRRASLLTTEESKGVRLSFNKKGVVLSSRSPESGEATVNFPCRYEGADVEVGFNPSFITEALRVVDSEDVTLEMTAPNRPCLLRGGADFLYVIMPVNLQ
jgi:DNA polymerase III subunit beta